jgi:hypothetical protein
MEFIEFIIPEQMEMALIAMSLMPILELLQTLTRY